MRDRASRRGRLARDAALIEATLSLPATTRRPVLVLLSGLPGTGKSYFAHALAGRLPIVVLESDAVRKTLIDRPAYSRMEHARVFAALHEVAERVLLTGRSVLIDATSLKEMHRVPVYDIARRTGARLLVVRLVAPEAVALERIARRSSDAASASDADDEVFRLMNEEVEPIGAPHLTVDTSRDIEPALDAIVEELQAMEKP